MDADSDGFGSTVFAPSGPSNNSDCNDNNALFYQSTSSTMNATACSTYTWSANGITYMTSGTYTNTTTNAAGCPNVATLNLTIVITGTTTFYADADGDGFGNPLVSISATVAPLGYVLNNTDCDDTKPTVYPGAAEICYDGLDNNCNGVIDEGCTPIVSVLSPTSCGTTLATIDQTITANLVAGAQGYRFKVTGPSGVQTIDQTLRSFQLTQLASYAFNTTYTVQVAIRINNVWQPFFGSSCTVTTPVALTKVQTAQCGSTLTTLGDAIYANNVPYAIGYRFRVVNLLTSQFTILDRPIRQFTMSLLTSPNLATYNTTYSVEVAVRNTNGTYMAYGPLCNVTTPSFPTTSLQNSQCDYNVTSLSEVIYADSFAGATAYKFIITSAGGYNAEIVRTLRTFSLNMFSGILPSTTYTVGVRLQIGGVFGPIGKLCTLTTPGVARVAPGVINTDLFKVVAYPNPFAANFKLDVTTSSEASMEVRVYDMLGKLIENRKVETTEIEALEVGARYPSGVYNVIVTQADKTQTLRVIKR
jgi:Putative metal-binding motif/Secretion system C-terminal sorting domain